jgi:integrase
MPGKRAPEWTALQAKQVRTPGLYAVGVVQGLMLRVRPAGGKSWILRYAIDGIRRDHGLGDYPRISLAEARKRASEARDKIAKGKDPIVEARAEKAANRAAARAAITFKEAAARVIASREAGWRNPKHADQWTATIETYAEPVIGDLPLSQITTQHILQILEPHWVKKHETMTRLRARLETILDWGRVQGYRSGDNPARYRAHLDHLLPQISRAKRIKHQPHVPIERVGEFMAALRKVQGISARCLEFTLLTACRSGEARGATWLEIDLDAAVWAIPGARMKGGKPHRIALSEQAVALLKALPRTEQLEIVFASPNSHGPLSDMSMSVLMRRMGFKDTHGRVCVPHGLRGSFRTWCTERTAYPRDLVELCLAHVNQDRTEASYQHSDALDRRREIMARWADFCGVIEQPKKGNVVDIRVAAAR